MLRQLLQSWISPAPRRTARSNRARLQLLSLERRDTPSAPVIQNFSGRMIGDTWIVTGNIVDETAGHYSVTLSASGLGQVAGIVADSSGVNSSATYVSLVSNVPQITDFAIRTDSPGVYTIRGRVIDEDPAGLTVTLSSEISEFNGKT